MKAHFKTYFLILICFPGLLLPACKKFVELGPPPTQTAADLVYKTDALATSAVLGLYSSSGLPQLINYYTFFPGMSADDVQYNFSSLTHEEYENNNISLLNTWNENTWLYGYLLIKNTNNIIDGLNASTTLNPAVKAQLTGEAKFMRAFNYFYLVNLYGDVPMPVTGDVNYAANAVLPRAPATVVWQQIIADLKDAVSLLPETYAGNFRARVNKHAATTLLARAYLYNNEWQLAEAEASRVLAQSPAVYTLQLPANVFINNSTEIIWQIANTTGISTLGINYLAPAGSVTNYSLYDTVYHSFETNDLRKTSWTSVNNINGKEYYTITKYKIRAGTGNEYNVVFRLSELFLIRAEARVQLNNVTGAKADVDSIRSRADLPGLADNLTRLQMLLAIEQERKMEFFGEWGQRWLDLKRTKRTDAVVGGQKPGFWKPTAVLYPIPDFQRQSNPNLTQNQGY